MRISDWSADVCSSDLRGSLGCASLRPHHPRRFSLLPSLPAFLGVRAAKADGRCHRPDGLLKKKESGKMTIQYIAWNNLVEGKRNRRKEQADVAGLAPTPPPEGPLQNIFRIPKKA